MIIITAIAPAFLMESFQNKGLEVLYAPEISYDQLLEKVTEATGLVVTTRIKIDKRIIDRARKLKWIGRLGSGLELIDIDYAAEKNILCISTPEGNSNAVAEHTLGLLLNLTNRIGRSILQVRKNSWLREENRGIELKGKTIGIVGYGNTGQAFKKLLSSLDLDILAYDKYKFGFGTVAIKEVNFEQLCKYADVISFHVPLTEETKFMGNADFFNRLARKPFILNTSRGKIIETAALINALKDERISGAALDVLENENINQLNAEEQQAFDFLKEQDNVIITPHIAGYSQEAFYNMSKVLLKKLGM